MLKPSSIQVEFKNPGLRRKYEGKKIPMSIFVERYLDGDIDVHGDLHEFLKKNASVNYRLTAAQVKFIVSRFLPQIVNHTKKMDKKYVTRHYDRGNDFFEAFLAETMVYTSAFFKTGTESLEEAQRQKLDYVAKKLQLHGGEKILDIGCGWGTLVAHMAECYGADATGVTISEKQVQLGSQRLRDRKLDHMARLLHLDYRDIPKQQFDRVTVLEMAEHVGMKNFQKFLRQISGLLSDDGIFFLQIAGLRRNWNGEDFCWGTFMAKYIFEAADASLPLSYVTGQLEKAGFEIHSVENIGIHYSYTIARWYQNWLTNAALIRERYGERWYRLWQMFLAWSVLIAERGGSTCFQIVANKNTSRFDRHRWIGEQTGLAEFTAATEVTRQRMTG